MRQILYAMQFRGQATPADESGTALKAKTTASSCTITSVTGPQGISGQLQETAGSRAQFESDVTFTGETSFQESGTIEFGAGHRLSFSTVREGYIASSPDPELKHGCVIWKVERGEGQFEKASGLIVSNFFVSTAGEVTDNHCGVLFVQ